jgi:nitrogenase molybdenum-cofactor synthesis protein NifE
MGFSTDVSEMDVVFGGEKKIIAKAVEIAKSYPVKAIFVYTTCVTAMIGDDISTACKEAQEQSGIPVIPVESPGFIGNKNFGNKVAGDALLEYVIGTKEPERTTDCDINIIGDYNIAGELWQMMPVFKELGINVLASITGGSSIDEIATAHRAKCTLVICSRALLTLAEGMKKRYGIPFCEGSFYGLAEIESTLLAVADMTGSEELRERILTYTARKRKETEAELAPYLPYLKGKRVFVYTGGVKSWSTIYQLEELGMEVIGTSTRKSTEQDIEKIREHFEGTQKMLLEKGDGRILLGILEKEGADMLLAGGRNMYTAMKGRYPFVDVNQERIHGYAGYTGMVELAKQLTWTMQSPVWEIAKRKAPWE